MTAIVKSFATSGVDGYVVDVEVSVVQGQEALVDFVVVAAAVSRTPSKKYAYR